MSDGVNVLLLTDWSSFIRFICTATASWSMLCALLLAWALLAPQNGAFGWLHERMQKKNALSSWPDRCAQISCLLSFGWVDALHHVRSNFLVPHIVPFAYVHASNQRGSQISCIRSYNQPNTLFFTCVAFTQPASPIWDIQYNVLVVIVSVKAVSHVKRNKYTLWKIASPTNFHVTPTYYRHYHFCRSHIFL